MNDEYPGFGSRQPPVTISSSIILAGSCLLALSGCVTVPAVDRAPPGFEVTGLADGGCVVGSIGQNLSGKSQAPFGFSKLFYGPRGEKAGGQIKFGYNGLFDTPIDFKGSGQVATVFRLCMKAGLYEFRNVSFYYNTGSFEKSFSAREPFSLPFEITQGSVQYIGRFIANGIKGKNIVGLSIPTGGYFTVEDASQQDWPLLLQRNPDFPSTPVSAIAKPTRDSFPFIVSKADPAIVP